MKEKMNQMKKRLQKNLKTRELTKNEKILLSVLAGVILIWGSYKFIITPKREKLASLKLEKMEYQTKVDENNIMIEKEADINKEWVELNEEKEKIVAKYFPTIDQAQIIYLLNSLTESEEFSTMDLNFSRPTYEEIGGFEVKSMDISIPYSGNYEGIIDTINAIDRSPRKVFIDSLVVDRDEEANLNGSIDLKIYSLEGIVESDSNIIPIDTTTMGDKNTPFSQYDGYYVESDKEGSSDDESEDGFEDISIGEFDDYYDDSNGIQGNETETSSSKKEVLLDFEDENTYFLPSQPLVKGRVMQSKNAKEKKYSLRFEYDILAVEEENRAYVDITKKDITLKYPPSSIGMWLYSYDYSPISLGIGFKGQMGEREFLPLTEGIGWTGWKYLEVTPPSDLSIYPLKVDNIYVEMPKNREDFGVILMDQLEAIYPRNFNEDGSDRDDEEFIFHVVKSGESIEKIGRKYYGTNVYKDEIIKLNEIQNENIIPIGKVLVLKKR